MQLSALAGSARLATAPLTKTLIPNDSNLHPMITSHQPTVLDLEAERDQIAVDLKRLAQDPSPNWCEGVFHENPLECSKMRGEIFATLLEEIDVLNSRITQQIAWSG